MPRAPQPLQHILATDATLAAWDARRRHEEALTAIVRRHLPRALAGRIRVADARGAELELAADAGAIAAVVRQRTPDLLAELRREGWEFTGIRVRAQVRVDPAPAKKHVLNPIDRSALQPLARLADDLPPGPLKTSLARFLRRVG
ncbi:MAG: DciA family protein [Betaproteobacteria bacterium]